MAIHYLDYDGLLYYNQKMKEKLSKKVDAVTGKGLSSNDFTDKLLTKLNGIEAGANKFTYTLPTMSASAKGGAKLGSGLAVASDVLSVSSAPKLATARTISLTGDATGSASFDGSANASIAVTVADDSHNHTIANVDGLQGKLDAKLDATTAANTYAKKTDIAEAVRYIGSVATYGDLPTDPTPSIGDMYNIVSAGANNNAGDNVIWSGAAWDNIGGFFSVESVTNGEIDTIVAS